MLKALSVENFTVFPKIEPLQFSPGLNVFIGENGSGKTHLLKLLYSLIAASSEYSWQSMISGPTKQHLQKVYGDKLMGVFKPDAIGRLASRKQGRSRCQIQLTFTHSALNTAIGFGSHARTDVQIEQLPEEWEPQAALYLPPRELLTLYPGLIALYEERHVQFEETWRDTCQHLEIPLLKGRRSEAFAGLLAPLEEAMGGKVVLEGNGQFYLNIPGSGRMEMYLVAEGLRKLAMLAQLIANGKLQEQGYLFWDEPESNLNPRLIRLVAYVIHQLATHGVQIFVASHSYFLLKELEILAKQSPFESERTPRYFALVKEDRVVKRIECASQFSQLENLVMLDEELSQYDRDMEVASA